MSTTSSNSGHWQTQQRNRGQRGATTPSSRAPPNPGRARSQFTPYRGPNLNRGGRPGGALVHLPGPHARTHADDARLHHSIFMRDQPVTVDARVKDDSDKAVVARLNAQLGTATTGTGANEADDSGSLPLRPDFGTQGREIALRANYFPVQGQGRIFRYSVAIALVGDTRKLSRRVKHRVFQLAEQTVAWQQAGMPGHVAHDSAEKLVASIELPQPLTIHGAYYDVDENGPTSSGGAEYTLTLTFEEEVDHTLLNEYIVFDPIPSTSNIRIHRCLAGTPVDSQALAKVLSALNLVLTAHASQTGVKIGRGDDTKKHPDQRLFFDAPDPKDIGGGLTVREGFYVSVRPAHQRLMVNVNTCHAAFYKPQNFVTALEQYRQFVRGGMGTFGHQVRVETRPNKNVVMIQGISKENARQHKFKHSQYGWVTIEKYYELSEEDH